MREDKKYNMHQILLIMKKERIYSSLGQIILEYQNVSTMKWVILLLLKLPLLSFKIYTSPQKAERHYPPYFLFADRD